MARWLMLIIGIAVSFGSLGYTLMTAHPPEPSALTFVKYGCLSSDGRQSPERGSIFVVSEPCR